MNFCNKFGVASIIWYPASGRRYGSKLEIVGGEGYYWSASPNGESAYIMNFYPTESLGDYVYPCQSYDRSEGLPVRCIQESK